jgi:hypothetical protein
MSLGILKVVDLVVGLRVDAEVEREGLDTALHGESGYSAGATMTVVPPAPEEEAAQSWKIDQAPA